MRGVTRATAATTRPRNDTPPASADALSVPILRLAPPASTMEAALSPDRLPWTMPVLVILGFLLALYFLAGLRQIDQWETALKFTLGKFSGRVEPGLTMILPGI